MVDTIPSRDFIRVFHRLCHRVRLGRVRNPEDIKKRIRHVLGLLREGSLKAERGSTIKKWRGNYKRLRTLYTHGVHERVWDEAVDNPNSIYGLTLDYGYKRAKEVLKERAKRGKQLRRIS